MEVSFIIYYPSFSIQDVELFVSFGSEKKCETISLSSFRKDYPFYSAHFSVSSHVFACNHSSTESEGCSEQSSFSVLNLLKYNLLWLSSGAFSVGLDWS